MSCVLRVGAEGGSIELERAEGNPLRFRVRLVDASERLFEDAGEVRVREGPWLRWDAALAELEATAWRALYPLEVAEELRLQVWSQLNRIGGRAPLRHRARWEWLCTTRGNPD